MKKNRPMKKYIKVNWPECQLFMADCEWQIRDVWWSDVMGAPVAFVLERDYYEQIGDKNFETHDKI